ncbi:hypothetical protein [Paenibacillus sp. V4I7]|uniref:hypothetical protein n=1 Tax=Paenibacillus sp. V4I7 TaxID=3042307 RepID=UPI00278643CC|nr:hypothetical protein [Paenibacillus sp. V4I7]MDQ0902761.1 hypothetical protein [Paenibacillus sp. V4I7]
MEQNRIKKQTSLIEREDTLLEQIDTYQQLLSASWRLFWSSEEPIHFPTAKQMLLALRTVERSIEDELLDV